MGLENSIGKRKKFCPRHGAQNFFEGIPAEFIVRIEVSMQLSRGSGRNRSQLFKNAVASDFFRMRRRAKLLGNAVGRLAEVAYSATHSAV